MGFFNKKVTCSNCGKEIGLSKHKISDGWLCPECFKRCSKVVQAKMKKCSLEDIENDLVSVNEQKNMMECFNATKKIGKSLEIDEEKKQWLVPDGIFGGKKNCRVFKYEDLVSFELLEDDESIVKGGLGRAVAGGVLLGGVGAIVGGITGKKKQKKLVNSLKIKITVKDINKPTMYINLIQTQTKTSSFAYKMIYDQAQEIISTFAIMKEEVDSQEVEEKNIEGEFIYCRKCGNKLPVDSVFCSKCGEKLK